MIPEFPIAMLAAPGDIRGLLFQLLLLLGAAKLLHELFEYLHQPGIVGEIVAGVMLGPGVLGWIQPTDFLSALAELGAMFLLFRVGLEVRADDLRGSGGVALQVAILGVVVPLAAGIAISLAWHGNFTEALFLGAAMVATSVGITAQVLSGKGLLHHVASRTVLAAAIIDDVLGLIVLAIVSSLAKGDVSVPDLILTAALAIGFTVVVAVWGNRAMDRISGLLTPLFRGREAEFHLAIVFLLGMGILALRAGVAAIIGAFLAGMALSSSVSHRVHDMTAGLAEFLVPFFLAGIGLHFQFGIFRDPAVVVVTGVVLVAAVLSKLIGCGLGARSLGRANMFRVGAGMVPRGEVGMVVAQLGLQLGVIPDAVYGIVVAMSLLTTMVAPPLLSYAFRGVPAEASSAAAAADSHR